MYFVAFRCGIRPFEQAREVLEPLTENRGGENVDISDHSTVKVETSDDPTVKVEHSDSLTVKVESSDHTAVKVEKPDILQMCHILSSEVVSLSKSMYKIN